MNINDKVKDGNKIREILEETRREHDPQLKMVLFDNLTKELKNYYKKYGEKYKLR